MENAKQVEWAHASPADLVLPDGGGTMAYRAFSAGVNLVTSQMEVNEPTDIVFPDHTDVAIVSVQYFLSGDASIRLGTGASGYWSEDGLSVIRTDTPGFVLRVQPGQKLRHVCVCLTAEALEGMIGGASSMRLQQLLDRTGRIDLAIELPVDADIRRTASELYRLKDATGLGQIKAEGLALALLSDTLGRFGALDDLGVASSAVESWQAASVRAIRAVLDADPGHVFAKGELLDRFQMGEGMARRVFQIDTGMPIAAYARRSALLRARRQLQAGQGSIKQIGYDAGYGHVGNFTRAYRREFGENPSDTKRTWAAE